MSRVSLTKNNLPFTTSHETRTDRDIVNKSRGEKIKNLVIDSRVFYNITDIDRERPHPQKKSSLNVSSGDVRASTHTKDSQQCHPFSFGL